MTLCTDDLPGCFQGESGFTLVELMVAMALAGIILGSVMTAYISQQKVASSQQQIADMQQNIRAGLYMMEREIRMAGFNAIGSERAGITDATESSLTFTLLADQDQVDNDGDGVKDNVGELETISYALYDSLNDGDLDLGRRAGFTIRGGEAKPRNRQVVAFNIDALEFNYTLENGNQTRNPAQDDFRDIRLVQISLLARTDSPDKSFSNTSHYIPASGRTDWDVNGKMSGTGNPVNDGFRRRLLITTVHCRNMDL